MWISLHGTGGYYDAIFITLRNNAQLNRLIRLSPLPPSIVYRKVK